MNRTVKVSRFILIQWLVIAFLLGVAGTFAYVTADLRAIRLAELRGESR